MKDNKPFYKIWWFWLIVVVLIVIIGSMIFGGGSSSDDSSSSASGHTTTKSEKVNKKPAAKSKTLKIDYTNHPILAQKNYKLSFTDNSWDSAAIKVTKVNVFKLRPYIYDDSSKTKAQGFIIVHMVITANRDITAYPDQGTVSTSDGQQMDAVLSDVEGYKGNFAGDIAKGVTKQGDIMFPIEKLSDVNDIKTLRLKFDGSYDTDNYEDENANHDYDITLNLN